MKPGEFNFKVCIPLCNLTLKGYKVMKKKESLISMHALMCFLMDFHYWSLQGTICDWSSVPKTRQNPQE